MPRPRVSKTPPPSDPGTIWVVTDIYNRELLEVSSYSHWRDARERFHQVLSEYAEAGPVDLVIDSLTGLPAAFSTAGRTLRISNPRLC
jgi:hypothetical protein